MSALSHQDKRIEAERHLQALLAACWERCRIKLTTRSTNSNTGIMTAVAGVLGQGIRGKIVAVEAPEFVGFEVEDIGLRRFE